MATLKEHFETEEAAAKALKLAVDNHIKNGNELPKSLKGCDKDGGGLYLKIDRVARDLNLVFTLRTSNYQGVSFQGNTNPSNPWRAICNPVIPYAFFKTPEEAALAIRDAVKDHIDKGNKLPRSLLGCMKDGNNCYLRVDKGKRDLDLLFRDKKLDYQGVWCQNGSNKSMPWRIRCSPLIFTDGYKTAIEAADALKDKVEKHLLVPGNTLPRALRGCVQDGNGRYLKKNISRGHKNVGGIDSESDPEPKRNCLGGYYGDNTLFSQVNVGEQHNDLTYNTYPEEKECNDRVYSPM